MEETKLGRAYALVATIVVLLFVLVLGASFVISTLLGLPFSLGFSIPERAVGAVVLLAGLAVLGWVFRHRGPSSVISSTYTTFIKTARRLPLSDQAGRPEPLVVTGPQKYVRHPLYSGVVVAVLGWAILTAYTFVFIATVIIFAWFRFGVIRFEERELYALFGDQYRKYAADTPAMVPFTKRKKHPDTTEP